MGVKNALSFKARTINSLLVLGLFMCVSVSSYGDIKPSPQWAERYLHKHMPILLKNSHTDHVIAFYYFGRYQDFTIMGMERVKGDNYEPSNTILIFKNSILQGYYEEALVFPAGVSDQGQVFFPANSAADQNIDLAQGSYPAITFNQQSETASTYIKLLP
tara:strand:- start:32 stop:511 length:480 start_codon:yes stop_codon:yes gene_type:complete